MSSPKVSVTETVVRIKSICYRHPRVILIPPQLTPC
jgi:hypothetical protein